MATSLGSHVRKLREDRGWNQTDFAEASGVTRAHLSQIESGKIAFPNADIRRRLAKALGVSHLDLLIAAGEITESEIAASGAEGVVERNPDDRREQLIARLRAVPDGYGVENALETMLAIVEGDIKERRKGQRG